MPVWDSFLSERDKRIFSAAGYGARGGFGKRPVVLVIDVNYAFVGDRPEPIEESIKTWRNSCGEAGWTAMESIAAMLQAARRQGLPVVYSTSDEPRTDGFESGRWSAKNRRRAENRDLEQMRLGATIPTRIAPCPSDIVIRKNKPSVFFGTLLASYLTDLHADTIIACGTTTGGCVRATVLDGFSHNYHMVLMEEGTFDRGQASHAINLFDMQQKYADVISLEETLDYIRGLPVGLFDEQMPSLGDTRQAELVGAR